MISKELLSEVIEIKQNRIGILKQLKNEIQYSTSGGYVSLINVYELAHKCKEWAVKQNEEYINILNISSGVSNGGTKYCDMSLQLFDNEDNIDNINERFTADTEPEAIFKACEWILNKNNE